MDDNTVLRAGQFDNEIPNFTRAPGGADALKFPTSLTGVAKSAGQVEEPETSAVIDQSVIGTPAARAVDTTPVDNFMQNFSQQERDLISFSQFLTPMEEAGDVVAERIADYQREIGGLEAERLQMEERAGIPGLQEEQRKLSEDIRKEIEGLRAGLALEEDRVVPLEVITGRQASLERRSAVRVGALTAAQDAITGRIEAAQSKIDRTVDAKFAQLEGMINAENTMLSRFDSKAAREREAVNNVLLGKLQDRKDLEKEAMQSVTLAMQHGMSASQGANLMQQLAEGKISPTDVFSQTGNLLVDPLDRAIKAANYRKTQLEIEEYESTQAVMDGEFGQTISDAAGLLPSERGRTAIKNISTAIKNGNYVSASNQIENAVEEALTGENATKFGNQRNDYEYLTSLRTKIQEFADAGGDLNLLTGKAEEISRKLLGVTTNPELTQLAVELEREFQTYRTNATGAAFSKEESRDYEKVNPKTTGTLDLNLAVIDGARNQLNSRIIQTVETRVAGYEKIRNLSTGLTTMEYLDSVDTALQGESNVISSWLDNNITGGTTTTGIY